MAGRSLIALAICQGVPPNLALQRTRPPRQVIFHAKFTLGGPVR